METSNYWHALDRTGVGKLSELEVDPLRIGISHGIGDVGEGLKANIFRGLKNVELGFFGTGKGFRSQPTGATPESFGATEREDIRQLARINEVELSTHSAPDLGSLSGFTGERYSREAKEAALQEVRRALDFAADTARGGAVVVHIGSRNGELPRALVEVDDQFRLHPREEERRPIQLVHSRTGQLVSIPLNETFIESTIDEKTGEMTRKTKTFKDLYAEEKTTAEQEKRPIELKNIFGLYRRREEELLEGEKNRFLIIAKDEKQKYDSFKRIYDGYLKKLEDENTNPEALRTFVIEQLQQRKMMPSDEGVYNSKEWQNYINKPEEYLKERLKEIESNYKAHEEIAISRDRELGQLKQQTQELQPAQEYVLKEVKESLAQAALDAYHMEKSRGLERPLYISPENWSPESYGSHPREYKEIIVKSREEMQRLLEEKEGFKPKEARQIAEDHIRGTFDVGHLNFWRKYFKPSDPSDPKKADEEFRAWVDKEIDQLKEDNIIGNVHLSDNFGYHDEHLAPGQGNAPIEKFVEKLEKWGYKGKYIGEPGGQKEGFYHTAWTGALNTLRSPIYRVDGRYARWSDIEQSYFGNVPQSPGFLVGDIVPSKDWTLWSETPLE